MASAPAARPGPGRRRCAPRSSVRSLLEQVGGHGAGPRCWAAPTRHGPASRDGRLGPPPELGHDVSGLGCTVPAYFPGCTATGDPGPAQAQLQHHEIVAVDDLGGHVVGQLAGAAPGPRRHHRCAADRTSPLAKTDPSGPAISTASSASKRPDTDTTPAGSSDGPARPGPGGPRRRPRSSPTAPTAKAIHSLRAGSRRSRGPEHRAHPGRRPDHGGAAPRAARRRR